MAIKKFLDSTTGAIVAVKNGTQKAANKANKVRKIVARTLNELDNEMGGAVLNNPVSRAIVPYVNTAGYALDAFDSLMGGEVGALHPQITNGQIAGVSQTMMVKRSKPRITSSRGTIRIMHKELVGSVNLAGSGVVAMSPLDVSARSKYYLSPTNAGLTPWLASIAGSYDYFKYNRVRLVYVPLCATSSPGRVMLGYDPDATDSFQFSRAALSSYSCSVDSSAWGVAQLDCKLPTNQPWYQTNNITNYTQYSTSTQGAVFWATWGGNAVEAGELYILYDVTLKDPQPNAARLWRSNGSAITISNSFDASSPFTSLTGDATTIKIGFTSSGTYLLNFYAITTAATGGMAFLSSSGCTILGTQDKTGDGAKASASVLVEVNVSGLYDTITGHNGMPTVQLGNLTALAAWSIIGAIGETNITFP